MMIKRTAFGLALAACCWSVAIAQETLVPVEQAPPPALDVLVTDQPAPAAPEVNPDEMADDLNRQQQIKQTFTLERRINGEVVDVEKRTIVFDRKDPVYATESGGDAVARLKEAFGREVLTRTNAFEEAKLDFVIADLDRDGQMTAEEFVHLVSTWRGNDARQADPSDEVTARQRQYQAFIDELDPQGAEEEMRARALAKFAFMAGARQGLSRREYIREYLLDFDAMDKDGNAFLRGDELMRFRAANRGDSVADGAE